MRKQEQSIRSARMNRAANSRNQAVIRAKLTVLSRLAAIQIELTIVMHWKGGELRGREVAMVWRVAGTAVETIHSISGSIGTESRRRN